MTCDDVIDMVEPIAAGEVQPDADVRRHIESCPSCAAALATARRIEQWLVTAPVATPPVKFTATVLQRVRRERWQAEERVDRLFNFAIACAALLVVGGGAAVFNIAAVLQMAGAASTLLASAAQDAVDQAVPSLPTYVAATALLLTAVGMWVWSDTSNS